jgi:protein SCO1/2
MNRRAYLATVAAAGISTVAGCSSGESRQAQDTYLAPPDRQVDAADLPYPGHGQVLPDVTLPAPLHGEEISVRQFETDVFVTFFYSNCMTVCPVLVGALRNIQAQAETDGHGDDVTFLAVTFDPERDTESRLREYAEQMNVNREAGNWYFLRPDSVSRAETVVDDEFGVGFRRTHPEDMDMYMFDHFALIALANKSNTIEKAYTDKRTDWGEMYDAFETLREREG